MSSKPARAVAVADDDDPALDAFFDALPFEEPGDNEPAFTVDEHGKRSVTRVDGKPLDLATLDPEQRAFVDLMLSR